MLRNKVPGILKICFLLCEPNTECITTESKIQQILLEQQNITNFFV